MNGETISDIVQELLVTDKEYILIGRDKLIQLIKKSFEGYLISNKFNLSSREIEVLDLVSKGLSNKDISEQLYISSNTTRNHLSNIYRKLNVRNRAEAVSLYKNVSRETFLNFISTE